MMLPRQLSSHIVAQWRVPIRNLSTNAWLSDFSLLATQVPSAESLPQFEKWLTDNGVLYQDHLTIRDSCFSHGQGRTCHAIKNIDASTAVVQIPLRCLINSSEWKETAIGKIADASGIDTRDGNLYLSLALIQLWSNIKEGLVSFHDPYVNILPQRLPHIPLFWPQDDLTLLEGSPLLKAIDARRKEILKDFSFIKKAVESKEFIGGQNDSILLAATAIKSATAADFAVAEMLVCSRAFEVHGAGKGGRTTRCMVPLADMLNTALPHTCDVDFKVLNVKEKDENGKEKTEPKFVMHALHQLQMGQQIFDSYGYKSNHRYLLNYGFSFLNNER
jgi:hypothetical protein